MSRRDWYIILSLPLVAIGLDQATKFWAVSTHHPVWTGVLTTQLVHNPGVMMGYLSDIHPLVRTIAVSTLAAFLVLIYGAIQFILPIRAFSIRAGLSLLIGCFLANSLDRVFLGAVVDFLVIHTRWFNTAVFNVADVLQWPAAALVLLGILKDGARLLPDRNLRKFRVIHPPHQKKFILVLTGACLSSAITSGFFSYSFLKTALGATATSQKTLMLYGSLFVLVHLMFIFIVLIAGLYISHQSGGAVFAFHRYVTHLLDRQDQPHSPPIFRLRVNDDFKELEKLGQRLAGALTYQRRPQPVPPPFRGPKAQPIPPPFPNTEKKAS